VNCINTTTTPVSGVENIHRLKMHSTQVEKTHASKYLKQRNSLWAGWLVSLKMWIFK